MLACSEAVGRLNDLLEEVLNDPKPEARLSELLAGFEKAGTNEIAIALFESAFFRTKLYNYWLFVRMSQIYLRQDRLDAAFFCAASAKQIAPAGAAGPSLNHVLYRYFKAADRPGDIAELLASDMKMFPGAKLAPLAELEPWLRKANLLTPDENREITQGRNNYRVVQPSKCEPQIFTVFGGRHLPFAEAHKKPRERSAIDVVEMLDAELLVQDDQYVVVSSNGVIQRDLSLGGQMDTLKYVLSQQPVTAELEEAIVIQDHLAGHNYGHFLIDQTPRLALFDMAGVSVRDVAVFGSHITTGFQAQIIAALGVKEYFGTRVPARYKVKRLWISTDGSNPQPIAHYGETWGLNFVRKVLGLKPFTNEYQSSIGNRRLYISRNDGTGRHIANEAELLPLLQDYGFERVTCERLSFAEQVDLFKDASHVLGPHGAGLSNLIFAPQGLTFLEFFHPLFTPDNFAQLVPALQINYAAFMAKDALTDAPEMNDQTSAPSWDKTKPFPWRFRDMVVDKVELARYLQVNAK